MVCLALATPVAKTATPEAARLGRSGGSGQGRIVGRISSERVPCECRRLQHLHYFRVARAAKGGGRSPASTPYQADSVRCRRMGDGKHAAFSPCVGEPRQGQKGTNVTRASQQQNRSESDHHA